MKFSIKDFLDLVIFTEETLNGKLLFCAVIFVKQSFIDLLEKIMTSEQSRMYSF